eukprot:1159738-Prymnesium_polylepis.1
MQIPLGLREPVKVSMEEVYLITGPTSSESFDYGSHVEGQQKAKQDVVHNAESKEDLDREQDGSQAGGTKTRGGAPGSGFDRQAAGQHQVFARAVRGRLQRQGAVLDRRSPARALAQARRRRDQLARAALRARENRDKARRQGALAAEQASDGESAGRLL